MGTEYQERNALELIRTTQRTAAITHATAVFDALDRLAEDLNRCDRYDIAAETWRITADTDARLADEDITRLAARAADHLASETFVDLIDIQFGEEPKKISTPDGHILSWLPEDETVITGRPGPAGIAEHRVITRWKGLDNA